MNTGAAREEGKGRNSISVAPAQTNSSRLKGLLELHKWQESS